MPLRSARFQSAFFVFLIDSLSIWAAILVFFAVNYFLGRLPILDVLKFNSLFFVGFTLKASIVAFVIGPFAMLVMRAFKRTTMWDVVVLSIALTLLTMALRYFTCAFQTFDRHVYFELFDPGLDYQTQCAYFSLVNFVLAVPKAIIVGVSFGLFRSGLHQLLVPKAQTGG